MFLLHHHQLVTLQRTNLAQKTSAYANITRRGKDPDLVKERSQKNTENVTDQEAHPPHLHLRLQKGKQTQGKGRKRKRRSILPIAALAVLEPVIQIVHQVIPV